jgi:hypothetical protein
VVQAADSPDEKLRKLTRFTPAAAQRHPSRSKRPKRKRSARTSRKAVDAGDALKRGYADGHAAHLALSRTGTRGGLRSLAILDLYARPVFSSTSGLANPWQLNSNAVVVKVG